MWPLHQHSITHGQYNDKTMVTFPAAGLNHTSVGTTYYFVTGMRAHKLSSVVKWYKTAGNWTHDVLIASSMPQYYNDINNKFAHSTLRTSCSDTPDATYSLYITFCATAFPIKICPFPWRIWCLSNTSFLGPTRPTNPNGISIESTVFPEYTVVTNEQRDRPTDRRPIVAPPRHPPRWRMTVAYKGRYESTLRSSAKSLGVTDRAVRCSGVTRD